MDSLPQNGKPNVWLQPHILLNLLIKLPNIPLCRLRRTCRFMDEFVEDNRKKLASRETDDLKLRITIDNDRNLVMDKFGIGNERIIKIGNSISLDNFDFAKQTSGVTIKLLLIMAGFSSENRVLEKFLLKTLEDLPECHQIHLDHMKIDNMLRIIEFTKVRSHYTLSSIKDDDEVNRKVNVPNRILKKLKMNREKRHLFHVSYVDPTDVIGLFDRVKYIYSYVFKAQHLDLKGFLTQLFFTNDPGNIHKIKATYSFKYDWLEFFNSGGVAFTTLCSIYSEQEITRFHSLRSTIQPASIFLTPVCNKLAIVIEWITDLGIYTLGILFVNNREEVWPCVANELVLTAEDKEELQAADETEKPGIVARSAKILFRKDNRHWCF